MNNFSMPFNLKFTDVAFYLFSIFFTVDSNIMCMNLVDEKELFVAAGYMTFVEDGWVDFFEHLRYTNKMCPHSMFFVFYLRHVCFFSRETFSFAYLFFANGALVKLWIMDIFVVFF